MPCAEVRPCCSRYCSPRLAAAVTSRASKGTAIAISPFVRTGRFSHHRDSPPRRYPGSVEEARCLNATPSAITFGNRPVAKGYTRFKVSPLARFAGALDPGRGGTVALAPSSRSSAPPRRLGSPRAAAPGLAPHLETPDAAQGRADGATPGRHVPRLGAEPARQPRTARPRARLAERPPGPAPARPSARRAPHPPARAPAWPRAPARITRFANMRRVPRGVRQPGSPTSHGLGDRKTGKPGAEVTGIRVVSSRGRRAGLGRAAEWFVRAQGTGRG